MGERVTFCGTVEMKRTAKKARCGRAADFWECGTMLKRSGKSPPGPKMDVGPLWETPGGYLLPEFADGWLCNGYDYRESLEHMCLTKWALRVAIVVGGASKDSAG